MNIRKILIMGGSGGAAFWACGTSAGLAMRRPA